MSDTSTAPRVLDLRGLKCPLPALRARKAVAALTRGETIVVECTDPMAAIDIPHFAREAGHELLEQRADGDVLTFRIRKGRICKGRVREGGP